MKDMRGLVRIASAAAIAAGGAAAYLLACGPFVTLMLPADSIRPGRLEPYNRGELGVVREHFARRYLVQAYRRFSGRPPIDVSFAPDAAPVTPYVPEQDRGPQLQWRQLHQRVTGVDPKIDTDRRIAPYQLITNCLDDTFAAAAKTGQARVDKYGPSSAEVREWFRAQDAVLANCAGDGLVSPDPAPANADALTRADRAYQIAAAHFYAMQFDEAERRFKQIAADATSPWRPYGRYLAGRSMLREATIPETFDRGRMLAAQTEFRATVADPGAAFLHESAKGLLKLITFRTEPVQLLRDLSPTIAGDAVTAAQLRDYEQVMDKILDDTTTFDYGKLADRDAIAASGDVNDWVVVMQGTGDGAAGRAIAQWKRTSSPAWLVASLWKIPATHADAPALLDAASRVDAKSPAFLTVAFLRVRLLAERGQADAARAVLAALPRQSRGDADAEAVNLLNAERFMLARSMGELLESAPRRIVSQRLDASSWRDVEDIDKIPQETREAILDDDAGVVFSRHLPLARLVEAATSTALPGRLRLRIASAAFVRAWMLGRDQDALAVAPALRTLSPSMAADVQKFEAASAADRHVAGLRLLLRTPGLHANVRGLEDNDDYTGSGLSRDFDHLFRRNWWCAFGGATNDGVGSDTTSATVAMLYRSGGVPAPGFLSADERAAVLRELTALAALPPAPNHLAAEAVAWAKARPTDQDAAEGLAHAVEGTRWGCGDARTTSASRTAFQTLHQLFPKSSWALKTKYWY